MAKKVLVTDHVFGGLEIERAALEPLGAEVVLSDTKDEASLVEQAASADALMVCFAQLTAPILEAAAGNGCKIVSRYGIGIDNIDVAVATELGMQVTNVPDYCLDEVADHAMATMLALAREVVTGANVVRDGGWSIPHGTVHRIRGRRLALLGVGRIGRRVVERALPFGLDVVGYDPFLNEEIPGLTQVDSPAEAVREADFVSLHAPLTDDTHHIVGTELIEAMEKAPIVVNTSRGPLVDAEAALAGLESGKLGGVALDVTEPEPLPDGHPLRTHPRAIVTPHMAFYSVEAEAELQSRAADEVARYFNGDAAAEPGQHSRVMEPLGFEPAAIYPDLRGKVAVVTGGSKGIGAATCELLVANGVKVAVVSRSQGPIDELVERLGADNALGISADGTDPAELDRVREETEERFGPVSLLAPFAGGFGAFTPVAEMPLDEWRTVIEDNLTSTFIATKAFLGGMLERGEGSIVTMSSISARFLDKPTQAAYAASKAGVIMFTRHLAQEVGEGGVRVNSVAPGTTMSERIERIMDTEAIERTKRLSPMNLMGMPEDTANATVFLLSDAARWLTGVTIDVNGGRVML